MHLLVCLRVHEVEFVALVVEVLEFHFVEDGAFDEFLGAEPVIDDRAGFEILHARLHGTAFVAGRAVIDAKNREKLALVLDDHAGAKLCGLDAAHMLPKKFRFRKFRRARIVAASGMTRRTPAHSSVPARMNSIRAPLLRGQSGLSSGTGSARERPTHPCLRS